MAKTTIPDLTGPLSLDAGEDAIGIGTKKIGALAQVSGAALGFDLCTPTADCTYTLEIRVQDVATGTPTNVGVDTVRLTATGVWAPVSSSVTTLGAPGARTYTKNGSALKVAIAGAGTWYADIVVQARFPA